MIYYVNDCCGCAVPGYPCLGSGCSLRHSPRWKCDICGEDDLYEDDMYEVDDDVDICKECHRKEQDEEDE